MTGICAKHGRVMLHEGKCHDCRNDEPKENKPLPTPKDTVEGVPEIEKVVQRIAFSSITPQRIAILQDFIDLTLKEKEEKLIEAMDGASYDGRDDSNKRWVNTDDATAIIRRIMSQP